jgi:hypothetical protein
MSNARLLVGALTLTTAQSSLLRGPEQTQNERHLSLQQSTDRALGWLSDLLNSKSGKDKDNSKGKGSAPLSTPKPTKKPKPKPTPRPTPKPVPAWSRLPDRLPIRPNVRPRHR